MQDRFKFRIAVFERYNTDEWEFTKFIENTDKFGVSTNGNVIQENVQSYIIHLTREKTPKNVYRTMEVMQCTGLKDKNSKLIYEGDICKYKFEEIGEQKAIIYFNKELCSFLAKPLNDFQYIRINDCEVIGNIYENPELFKGGNNE